MHIKQEKDNLYSLKLWKKSMKTTVFEQILNTTLTPEIVKDYCPNGLQVAGSDSVSKVITGVTASQALIDYAVAEQADALVVHHGFFWKNEDYRIIGMKYKRIKALIDANINLFAYHLPLDIHPELGNNAQLAKLLNIAVTGRLPRNDETSVVFSGELENKVNASEFAQLINTKLSRDCIHVTSGNDQPIKTIAWCTGGGQNYIDLAALYGIDAFISGEISEQTTHSARELGIHYFAAGHHATERYGAKALAEFLQQEHNMDATFIDIDNPA